MMVGPDAVGVWAWLGSVLVAVLRAVGGGKYVVMSHTGRRLSRPLSRRAARRRLRQIEFFKRVRPRR